MEASRPYTKKVSMHLWTNQIFHVLENNTGFPQLHCQATKDILIELREADQKTYLQGKKKMMCTKKRGKDSYASVILV